MKNKTYLLTLLALLVFNTKCSQNALELDNPNQPTESSYYQTERDFIAASNAMYSPLQKREMFYAELQYLFDLRGDEYAPTFKTTRDAQLNSIQTFTYDADHPRIKNTWRYFFEIIYRTNIVLEKIESFKPANTTRKDRIIGEAKFLRGFAYYHLVNNFGDVPLFTSATEQKKLDPVRAPKAEVINQIIADWTDAKTLLPTPAEWGPSELGRATKGAAQAFLGKLYMMLGRYADAKTELAAVINSGVYELVPEYSDNFQENNENNAESIFEVQFNNQTGDVWDGGLSGDQAGAAEQNLFDFLYGVPQGQGWNLQPSKKLFNTFEPADPRRNATIFYTGGDPLKDLNGNDIVYDHPELGTRKYLNNQKQLPGFGGPFSGINIRLMRYAEVLLLYAEALNETDGPVAALPFINQVRARVDMPAYPNAGFPAATKDDVFNIIMHERMLELGGEQHRWYDLVRWDNNGKIDMNTYIKNAAFPELNRTLFDKTKHKLFPVPQSERNINSKLTQNPGY